VGTFKIYNFHINMPCKIGLGVCMCGFCNAWVCVCVGLVMCVCVCVCMCGCVYVRVL
jgi:hypothetical protein